MIATDETVRQARNTGSPGEVANSVLITGKAKSNGERNGIGEVASSSWGVPPLNASIR